MYLIRKTSKAGIWKSWFGEKNSSTIPPLLDSLLHLGRTHVDWSPVTCDDPQNSNPIVVLHLCLEAVRTFATLEKRKWNPVPKNNMEPENAWKCLVSKRDIIFQGSIFRFHASFRMCKSNRVPWHHLLGGAMSRPSLVEVWLNMARTMGSWLHLHMQVSPKFHCTAFWTNQPLNMKQCETLHDYMYRKTTSGPHRLANAGLQNMEKNQPNVFHTRAH